MPASANDAPRKPATVRVDGSWPAGAPVIQHVRFDADGVLQVVPDGGGYARMERHAGDRARELLHRAWAAERQMLAGRGGEYLPFLADLLVEYEVTAPVEQVYADVWLRIERVEATFAVVEALRRSGYGVHLGTNQERERGEHMRARLGYDALFDTSCYSYDLGVAKPDPAFFVEAARRIGADPASIVFVDDTLANVDAAVSAGLAATHWRAEDGQAALLEALTHHGITPTLA